MTTITAPELRAEIYRGPTSWHLAVFDAPVTAADRSERIAARVFHAPVQHSTHDTHAEAMDAARAALAPVLPAPAGPRRGDLFRVYGGRINHIIAEVYTDADLERIHAFCGASEDPQAAHFGEDRRLTCWPCRRRQDEAEVA